MLKRNRKGVYEVFDKKLREETGETGDCSQDLKTKQNNLSLCFNKQELLIRQLFSHCFIDLVKLYDPLS